MADLGYARALERAGFILGPPRIKGMVLWSDAGLRAVRLLVTAFMSLVSERRPARAIEHGFLADGSAYRSVFGDYANVYEVAPEAGHHGGSLLRPDNLVTSLAGMRAEGVDGPWVAVGGLLRRFNGATPPLFRDRYIWPAVQLTERVRPADALNALEFYRGVVERLLARAGLPSRTVRTPALAGYGRVTYLVVSALPDGRPTVLATIYLLSDSLRQALGEDWDVLDVGFTGKIVATAAMLHRDRRGLVLPTGLAPVQVGVTPGPATDPDLLCGWVDRLGRHGIRAAVATPTHTLSRRDRVERAWHARGVPIVVGLGRHGSGYVAKATRCPLTRTPMDDLPGPARIRSMLCDHDTRLLDSANRIVVRSFAAGGHLRAACAPCAERLPVFGTIVPNKATACDTCSCPGRLLFVSEQGRFY